MSPPVNCHAIRLRYRRRRAGARRGWTVSVHIPLHSVPVYAQFPGDATNGQPLALSRLKWCGLPPPSCNGLANPPSAVAVGSVARYMDVELRKLVYPASARAIAVEMMRRSMRGSLGEVAQDIGALRCLLCGDDLPLVLHCQLSVQPLKLSRAGQRWTTAVSKLSDYVRLSAERKCHPL